MARNSGKEAYLEQQPMAQSAGWIGASAAMRWLVILFCLAIWSIVLVTFFF